MRGGTREIRKNMKNKLITNKLEKKKSSKNVATKLEGGRHRFD